MKGKKKKKGATTFKLTPKTEDTTAMMTELQMKKQILTDKLIIQKTQTNDSVRRLEEARTRFFEVKQFNKNENEKFSSIKSDFEHQNELMSKNFNEKVRELTKKLEEKENRKKSLVEELKKMDEEHNKIMQQKDEMFKKIKNNMETLSSDFSKELSEIQGELKKQTENISQKWEKEPSEHIKTFTDQVNKYDIIQGEDKNKEGSE